MTESLSAEAVLFQQGGPRLGERSGMSADSPLEPPDRSAVACLSVATGPFRPGGVIRGTVTIDGDACRVSIDLRRCDLAHGTKLHRPASATHLIEAGPDVETPFALENFGTGARTREDAPDEPMTDTLSEVTAKIGNIGCAGQGVTIVPVRKG